MSDLEFDEIERVAGGLLRQLEPSERRSLLRRLARGIQRGQSTRIGRQQAPDGARFAPRRKKEPDKPGAYPLKFLYPKGVAEPRLVLMKSWVRQGKVFTGYDIEAGGIRTFFWDKVAKFLPLTPEEQNRSAGKYRRKGSIRRAAMFRKLRNGRNLRAGATDREAWIGFTGRAAQIAQVHQEGGLDKPAPHAKEVRYAMRRLLGLSEADRTMALDLLLDQLAAPIGY